MSASVGENGIHRVVVESRTDALDGDTIKIKYQERGGNTIKVGDSATGVTSRNTMTFETDFNTLGISPGTYDFEFVHEDGAIERQLNIIGDKDNRGEVEVTEANSI